jgi:hypothetical protein
MWKGSDHQGTGERTPEFKKAAERYVHEVACHIGEYLEQPVDE